MTDYDRNKELQQNQILHIVKIASLFFSAIAVVQYQTKRNYTYAFSTKDFILLLSTLFIVLFFYIIWSFVKSNKKENQLFKILIEPSIFITISLICVLLTGGDQSNYKYLFLFVIISSSIECGIKIGLTTAGVSALVILLTDFVAPYENEVNANFEGDIVLMCVFLITSWTIGFYSQMEKRHIANLKDLVNIDGLTGLYNHRFFYDSLAEKIDQARQEHKEMALLFIDIDYFKNYNDINGHQKGDDVLRSLADKLKEESRTNDIVARYGGEEFAIILPDTSEQDAVEIAEKLRNSIQEMYFPGQEYMPNENLTISIGVSVFSPDIRSDIDIVKNADEALYKAKFLRKNRVEKYYSILDDLQKDVEKDDKEIIISIKTLIAVIDARDEYTFGHVERVVSYCLLMADKLVLDEEDRKILIYAAYMHDIGKINISQDILIKDTPLTKEEWEILKSHPKNAADIIKNVSVLKDVIPIILEHHEKFDGSGYPKQLKGDTISYLARILTVVDSFDAMTSNRPYQRKKSISEAFDELIKCSGTHFDPEIVPEFIKAVTDNMDES